MDFSILTPWEWISLAIAFALVYYIVRKINRWEKDE